MGARIGHLETVVARYELLERQHQNLQLQLKITEFCVIFVLVVAGLLVSLLLKI